MRNQFMFALAAAILGAIGMFGFVQATPSVGVTSTLIALGRFGDIDAKTLTDTDPDSSTDDWQARIRTKGSSDLYVLENRIAPGGTSAGTRTRGRVRHRQERRLDALSGC